MVLFSIETERNIYKNQRNLKHKKQRFLDKGWKSTIKSMEEKMPQEQLSNINRLLLTEQGEQLKKYKKKKEQS